MAVSVGSNIYFADWQDEVRVELLPYTALASMVQLEVTLPNISEGRVTDTYLETAHDEVYPSRVTMVYLEVIYRPYSPWQVQEA